jgi:hypothetical protein
MDEESELFGNLFEMSVPVAPPLFVNGAPVVVPSHLAKSMVFGGSEDEQYLESVGFPPTPVLRRNISLSKNTSASLQSRLSELSLDLIATESAHKRKMAELEAQVRQERVLYSEKAARIHRETAAVEQALLKVQQQEQQRAEEKSSPCSCSAPTCSSPSVLSVRRSPGETVTGDETGCGVCLSADRDTLVAPCGHVAMCFKCSQAIKNSRNPECPFCRCKITAVYKLFVV